MDDETIERQFDPAITRILLAGIDTIHLSTEANVSEAVRAKLDEAKEGAMIQVVDPAIPPDRRSSPKRAFIVLISTFAGFMMGVLLALLQVAYKRLKDDPEANHKLNLLGRLFSLKKRQES